MAVLNQKVLENDIQKYLYTFADSYCRDAEVEITKMAKYAIKQFYEDYTPNYYDRTDDLKNNSYTPYYHNNGKAIYGGVRINSDKMQPYQRGTKYETDPIWIAGWAWEQGYHGHPIRQIQTTPPLDMVRGMMKESKFLNKIQTNAERVATSQEYSILQF